MKIASLVIGIVLMILAGIAFVVCLALPAMTDNRVSFEESILGLIPSAIVFFLAFVLTVVSAIFVFKGRKSGRTP
jgi:uncharacterized membrane protein